MGVFLKKHGFLVGLSIDGPKELHDHYRVAKDGAPTFDKVLAAARCCIGIRAIQCIVRHQSGERQTPLDVYRFLKNEIRPRQMQFIPCVEPKVFHHIAPQKWDEATLPNRILPPHIQAVQIPWSPIGRSIRMTGAIFSARFGTTGTGATSARCSSTISKSGGAVDGSGFANVHLPRVLRQGRGAGTRRQSLLLRPLCLSGVQARQHSGNFQFADGFLRAATQVRIRQVQLFPVNAASANSFLPAMANVPRIA